MGLFLEATAREEATRIKNERADNEKKDNTTECKAQAEPKKMESRHSPVKGHGLLENHLSHVKDYMSGRVALDPVQLKAGHQFLPKFLYLENDQDRPPVPVFRSVYASPKPPRASPDKMRLEDLCKTSELIAEENIQRERGVDVIPLSYREMVQEVQKIRLEEHPSDTIKNLSVRLQDADAKILQQQQVIRTLERNHRGMLKMAIQKVQQFLAQSHLDTNKHSPGAGRYYASSANNRAAPCHTHLRLPKLTRDRSPTLAKGGMPERNIFGQTNSSKAKGKDDGLSKQTATDLATFKRFKALTKAQGEENSSGEVPGAVGKYSVSDLGAGGDSASGHSKGGTPVRLVDMDTLKSTLAGLLVLQQSRGADASTVGVMEGWTVRE